MTYILGTTNTMEAQCKTMTKIYAKKGFPDLIIFFPDHTHCTTQVLHKLLTNELIFIQSNTKWPMEGLH